MTNRIKAESVPDCDLSTIKRVSGSDEIRNNYGLYMDDESHSFDGHADELLFPTTEAEVVTILRNANARRVPVTVQGGRTGLTGAAVPLGGIALNLEKMSQILYVEYDTSNDMYSVGAQPGVLLEELVKAVSSKNLSSLKGRGTPTQEQALAKFFAESGTFSFPVDPTETTAWLGGIVACNASGARTFRYGAVRDWVRRIRVALMNGDVLDIRRGAVRAEKGIFEIELSSGNVVQVRVPNYKMPATKNAAGLYASPDMDLIDLFIGSEGILGVITLVELGLYRMPENIIPIMAFFPSEDDAVGFVEDARRKDFPVKLDFLEYFGPEAVKMIQEKASGAGIKVPAMRPDTQAIVFFQFAYYSELDMDEQILALDDLLHRHNSSSESSWAGMDRAELEKMKTVRHFVPETINATIAKRKQQYHEVHKIGTDMAVPDEALREYLRFYRQVLDSQGMEYVIFGHIGNNHLHVNMIPRNNEEVRQGMENYMLFAKKAVELGGTVAAEHGIGKLKRDFLEVMYGRAGIEQMQAVKRALDPLWLLNRGNMIPVPEHV